MIDAGTKKLLKQIDAKRKELAIPQSVLGEWLGVTQSVIASWFTFVYSPRRETIQRMVDILRECEEGKRQYTPNKIMRERESPKVPYAAVDYLHERVKRHRGLTAKIARKLGLCPQSLSSKLNGYVVLREYEAAVILEMLKEAKDAR